ncbi:hypothetical protein G6F43_012305 [Rhizopus delemar]|nr:hypothetical protein G6F43_012305 [Rhizopus delemar]
MLVLTIVDPFLLIVSGSFVERVVVEESKSDLRFLVTICAQDLLVDEDVADVALDPVTSITRGAGARMCDLGGVEDASIRRLGRWNSDSMNGAYVTGLPREAMRSLAGFGKVKGNFYLPRANLDPCVELQKKVFPLVDEWLDKLDANTIEYNVARGFLTLMKQLRITFLQDSALIMKDLPAHPVFKHDLFSDPLFVTFKSNLEDLLLSDSTPQEITLLRAMPALAKELDTRFNAQDASLRLLLQQNQELQSKLEDIATGRAPVPVRVTVDFSDGNQTVTGVTSNSLASELQGNSQVGLLSLPSPTTIDTMMFNASDGQQASTSSVSVTTSTQGVHRWSEGVHTIHDLWREYTVGLGGNHSIEELNKSQKPWYPKSHKTFHYRRMRIIKAIKNYAEEHSITTDTAVQIAERRRLALQTSLDSIGKNISKLFTMNPILNTIEDKDKIKSIINSYLSQNTILDWKYELALKELIDKNPLMEPTEENMKELGNMYLQELSIVYESRREGCTTEESSKVDMLDNDSFLKISTSPQIQKLLRLAVYSAQALNDAIDNRLSSAENSQTSNGQGDSVELRHYQTLSIDEQMIFLCDKFGNQGHLDFTTTTISKRFGKSIKDFGLKLQPTLIRKERDILLEIAQCTDITSVNRLLTKLYSDIDTVAALFKGGQNFWNIHP